MTADAVLLRWRQRLKELAVFKKKHGHCDVPPVFPPNQPLANWVRHIRHKVRPDRIPPDIADGLKALDFSVHPDRLLKRRNAWIAKLTEYHGQQGHCNVPKREPEHWLLRCWIANIRNQRRHGNLDPECIAALDKLDFEWEPQAAYWNKKVAALVKFKARHGHYNIPQKWPPDPRLGAWVCSVRRSYRQGLLSPEQIQELEALGFQWTYTPLPLWDTIYAALVKYQRKYGHCRVSTLDRKHISLANWVRTQRAKRRDGTLTAEQIERLDALGFLWEVPQELWLPAALARATKKWEEQFAALVEYKESHGDCNVPGNWAEDRKLANWVATQRASYRKGKLAADRKKRLTAIGLRW